MDDQGRRVRYERRNDPSRVLALSDGVFAIVLTLLVLELNVPDLSRGQTLGQVLAEIRPSFVAFLISFVVVAIAWLGHRALFALIQRTDRALVLLNLLYLLPLCILPFGASLISRYDTDPVALGIYGMVLIAILLTRLAIWWYATGRAYLLYVPIDRPSRLRSTMVVGLRGLAYLGAIFIAGRAPAVSLAIYGLIPLIYLAVLAVKHDPLPADAARDIA
jgi:uncharacterized membrane protein